MGLNTGAVGQGQGSTTHYGHADYARDKAAGKSDAELLRLINADPSKMGNGGVGGDLYNQIAAGANSSGSSSGGSPSYSDGSVGKSASSYAPPAVDFNRGDVNFNPGGVDMGDSSWSNDEFVRSLAKERAQAFSGNNNNISETNTITNDIEQNIGNKGDFTTNIGDGNTINGSSIGNDYSLNLGSISLGNQIY